MEMVDSMIHGLWQQNGRTRFWRKWRAGSLIGVICLSLVACSSDGDEIEYKERPVEDLYNTAMDELSEGGSKQAAQLFDEVERQHPYSVWATKAQLMSGYAYYKADAYPEAVAALDRFIQLHPGHQDIAYAYYLKALCYYEQISDVARDQKMTKDALETLEEVVKRFPNTQYARDSKLKIDLTKDHLAGKQMAIGRYYLNKEEYVAAINRFRIVVEQYQTTTHAPEALHRLTEAYIALGVVKEAQMAAAVLGHNFPGSEWYKDSFELLQGRNLSPERDSGSWLDWIF